jgi:integrase
MTSDTDGGRDGAPSEAKGKSATPRKRAYGDGSFFERKDGRWVAAVRNEGKRFVRYATPNNRKGAIEALRTLQKELAEGQVTRPGQLTVADVATQWLDVLTTAGRSEGTMRVYRRLLEWYVLPAVGRTRLRDLKPSHLLRLYARVLTEGRTHFGTPADVLPETGWPAWQRPKRRYLPSLGKQVQPGLAPLTVAKVHAVMHQVCRLAVRYGYTTRNVAREAAAAGGVPRPRSPEQRPLSPVAVHTLLAAARERAAAAPGPTGADPYLAAYHVLLDTGCRVGEGAALRWVDVRLEGERPAVTVRARLANERVGPPEFRVPKTASTRRTMGITPATAECLRTHRQLLSAFRAGRGLPPPGPEDLVFPARPGVTKNPDGTDSLPPRLLA